MNEPTEMVKFAGKIPVNILKFRRDKHDFQNGWETEYLNNLIDALKPGMTIFDIGAENGEFTAMTAKIVGCENVHIFEPSPDYWPNIKRLWDINGFEKFGGVFNGYVSDKQTTENQFDFLTWPSEAYDEIFYGTNQVVPSSTPRTNITIDYYCEFSNAKPDVILMDIEGAELSAIRGAIEMIKKYNPIIFISIHDDNMIMERSEGTKQDLLDIFYSLGYVCKYLYKDHEEHWKFYKK